MKILISFCNQTEKSKKSNLLLYDLDDDSKKYLLDIPVSLTGIAQDKKYIYTIAQETPSRLFVIDKLTHETVCEQLLENVIDPHSMVISGEYINIVSTGTDSVIQYRYDDNQKKVFFVKKIWSIDESNCTSDTQHINSIFLHKDDMYISAFGPKKGERWSTANNGYIYDVTNKKKLPFIINHPHSIFMKNKNIFYCESATGKVKCGDKTIAMSQNNYVRGLSLSKRYLIHGISGGRKKSKSMGVDNTIAEAGLYDANCKVVVYKKGLFFGKYHKLREVNFFPRHVEIYDILVFE